MYDRPSENLNHTYFDGDITRLMDCVRHFPADYQLSKKDAYNKITADFQAGYTDKIHPDLFKTYGDNLRKAVAGVIPDGKYGSAYFDLRQKFDVNVSKFAASKAYIVTDELRKCAEKYAADPEALRKGATEILNTFNRYQAAEYNATVARSRTAKQWKDFNSGDNAIYQNIRWLPSRSASPREEHIVFWDRVWAKDDPFWDTNQPGNLWGCKCDWELTNEPAETTDKIAKPQNGLDNNPGKSGEIFTKNASYFKELANNKDAHKAMRSTYFKDSKSNLRISVMPDLTEIDINVDTGRTMATDTPTAIRPHIIDGKTKNAEFTVNEMLADAKRIESYKGVAPGFTSAIAQGCEVIILDLRKMEKYPLNTQKLARAIVGRYRDFNSEKIKACYVTWKGEKVALKGGLFKKFTTEKREKYYNTIASKIEKLK